MKRATYLTGSVAFIAVWVVLVTLLVNLMWGWTVPDLFPGAVEAGHVAATISWWSAFKMAFLVGLVAKSGNVSAKS